MKQHLSLLSFSFALIAATGLQAQSQPNPDQAALLAAFDADKDGKLSPEELAKARAALRSLDTTRGDKDSRKSSRTQDGKSEEGGYEKKKDKKDKSYGSDEGYSKKPKDRKSKDHHDDDDDDDIVRTKDAKGSKGNVGASPGAKVTQLLSYDKNGDGKLSADEVPSRMAKIVTEADTDKKGFATAADLEAYFAKQADSTAAAPTKDSPKKQKAVN